MSAYRNNDPNEWADKRRAAMERAKQIREERKNASADGATFQPQINKRPSYLGSRRKFPLTSILLLQNYVLIDFNTNTLGSSDALDALTSKAQSRNSGQRQGGAT